MNEQGIFDEEILQSDNSTINDLNSADIDDIVIYTTFYKLNFNNDMEEDSQLDHDSLESNLEIINCDEINKIIAEVYYNIDTIEEKKSIVDRALEIVGIKPIDVMAKDYNSNSAYMKKSVIISPVTENGKKYYRILFCCNWIKMPKFRNADVMYLIWDEGAVYDHTDPVAKSSTFAKMQYTYTSTKRKRLIGEVLNQYSKTVRQNFSTSDEYYNILSGSYAGDGLPIGKYSLSNHSMTVAFDLPDDETIIDEYYNTVTDNFISSMIMSMSVYVKRIDTFNGFVFDAVYNHTKAKWAYDVKAIKISIISPSALKIGIANFILSNKKVIQYTNYVDSCGGDLGNSIYIFK